MYYGYSTCMYSGLSTCILPVLQGSCSLAVDAGSGALTKKDKRIYQELGRRRVFRVACFQAILRVALD